MAQVQQKQPLTLSSASATNVDADLEDYGEDDVNLQNTVNGTANTNANPKSEAKGSYVGIHTAGFRDFLLKPELLQAVSECGFEHPSEVQHECIPQAILGTDVICQAKSGMGKTAVFVIATLQQIEPSNTVDTLVLCHTRELAYQICHEFERFAKHIKDVKTAAVYGGIDVDSNRMTIKQEKPNIVVGTPGRVMQLVREGVLSLSNLKRFILDECDRMLDQIDMRRDVQTIFRETPHEKQVMMFSATISKTTREVCRKFAQNPMEIFVDDESKLTLHGLQQHYVTLTENQKNRKLSDLLDLLDFNQVVIFVKSVRRATELNRLLIQSSFPSLTIHSGMKQEDRIAEYTKFKENKARVLVSTDVMGRGVDIERVNIVINYDMAEASDAYLHRVGRAGRFGTKGLAISFISSEEDKQVLNEIQKRFLVKVTDLPDKIDSSSYMTA